MNIVSGFIANVNKRSDRDITKYLHFGFELMAVEIPMTIFIERQVFEEHIVSQLRVPKKCEGEFVYRVCGGVMDGIQHKYSYQIYGHITFVFFEIENLFLWAYRAMAHKFRLNTGNPSKDTLEYMMVQCQKTEWIAIAMQLCSSGSSVNVANVAVKAANVAVNVANVAVVKEYIWIDFGAFHMFQGKIDVFQTELYTLRSRVNRRLLHSGESSRICMASCWNPTMSYYGDIYKDVNWLFAGSVFGGGANILSEFAMKMREKCIQILREKNTLMWEINIWAVLYREAEYGSEHWMKVYASDHSEILVRGYI